MGGPGRFGVGGGGWQKTPQGGGVTVLELEETDEGYEQLGEVRRELWQQ